MSRQNFENHLSKWINSRDFPNYDDWFRDGHKTQSERRRGMRPAGGWGKRDSPLSA